MLAPLSMFRHTSISRLVVRCSLRHDSSGSHWSHIAGSHQSRQCCACWKPVKSKVEMCLAQTIEDWSPPFADSRTPRVRTHGQLEGSHQQAHANATNSLRRLRAAAATAQVHREPYRHAQAPTQRAHKTGTPVRGTQTHRTGTPARGTQTPKTGTTARGTHGQAQLVGSHGFRTGVWFVFDTDFLSLELNCGQNMDALTGTRSTDSTRKLNRRQSRWSFGIISPFCHGVAPPSQFAPICIFHVSWTGPDEFALGCVPTLPFASMRVWHEGKPARLSATNSRTIFALAHLTRSVAHEQRSLSD